MIRRFVLHIALGLIAGLLAGPALGLGEWLVITQNASRPDTQALVFGVVAYAIVAALFGMGLGVVGAAAGLALERRHPDRASRPAPMWVGIARYWAIDLGLIGVVVARFRITRDVFNEQLKLLSPQGLLVHAGLLVALALFVGLTWWLTRPPAKRAPKPSAGAAPESAEAHAETPTTVPSPARRQFLKTALTAGLVAAPPVAAAARLFNPSAPRITVPSVIRTTGVLSSELRQRPNIIYIMVDTLRADHLSCYGYPRPITPRIDALAAEGVRFQRLFAQASWTRPCVACQLASMYPSSHRAEHKVDRLPDAVTTLPEALARAGYATAGYAANVNVAPLFNFGQGFHSYEFLSPTPLFGATEDATQLTVYDGLRSAYERLASANKSVYSYYYPAEAINERALAWMSDHLDQRFFMFLHYMDPHDPYMEHPFNGYGIARVSSPNPPADMAGELKRLYVGEIEYLDRQLGELFDWLRKQGLYDDTLVVLTSDHGEEFQEHSGWWHGLTLYEEQIHLPFIVKPARSNAFAAPGTVDAGMAQQIDIMPTILSAVHLPRPDGAQGIDLLNPAERIDTTFAENQLEGNVLRSIRGTDWKLIEANAGNPRGLPAQQLFNVADDPGELNDRLAAEPERVAQLHADLDAIQAWAAEHAVATQETSIDAATQQQLRSIGY